MPCASARYAATRGKGAAVPEYTRATGTIRTADGEELEVAQFSTGLCIVAGLGAYGLRHAAINIEALLEVWPGAVVTWDED